VFRRRASRAWILLRAGALLFCDEQHAAIRQRRDRDQYRRAQLCA
jgi:hypothetical protein